MDTHPDDGAGFSAAEDGADPATTEVPRWHEQQEQILKRWSEQAASYRFLHDRAFAIYKQRNMWFSLPVIVLSTITGTANFAQGSFPESWRESVPLGIGALNLVAGLITTVAQFLRVAELFEGHRAASIAFGKLSRNIAVELSLPPEERSASGLDYVNICRAEMDRLLEQSPTIPLKLVQQFGLRFQGTTFKKPDILEITETPIYHRQVDEELERKKQEAQAAAAVEEKVHQAALEMRAIKKERRQSVSHVGKRLDRLLSSVQLLNNRHSNDDDDDDDYGFGGATTVVDNNSGGGDVFGLVRGNDSTSSSSSSGSSSSVPLPPADDDDGTAVIDISAPGSSSDD